TQNRHGPVSHASRIPSYPRERGQGAKAPPGGNETAYSGPGLELDRDAVVHPAEDPRAEGERRGRDADEIEHVRPVRKPAVVERGAQRLDRRGDRIPPAQ